MLARNRKSVPLIEADGADVVLVDVEVEPGRRDVLGRMAISETATGEPQASGATTIWSR